jgi:hypothetical protein
MSDWALKIIGWGLAVTVAIWFSFASVRWLEGCEAHGDDSVSVTDVARGVHELQPTATEERAMRLGHVFHTAGRNHDLDPLLLVAISFRESSLLESVEHRRRRGELGELGLMQCHGKALGFRPVGCDHHLVGARCQVETGAAYLAEARRQCSGSWWRWIAAYGMGACPTERYAKTTRGTQRACRYYTRIGGKRWSGCEVAAQP